MSVAIKAKVASAILLGLMALSWFTLHAGRIRLIALLILGLFLFRIAIHSARARNDEGDREEEERD